MRSSLPALDDESPLRHLDYLVGGLRIGLDDRASTVGPRSHIVGFTEALRAAGGHGEVFLASAHRVLGTFTRRSEGVGSADPGRLRLMVADGVRVVAALWSMLRVRRWSRGSTAAVIYERVAVMSCLGLAHRRRRRAIWVAESNGIFTRETGEDRRALGASRLAGRVERAVYRQSDLVVTVSRALRDEVCAFSGIRPDKVLVLPNAVHDAIVVEPRPEPAGLPIVGFAGTVVRHQRIDALLGACSMEDLRGRVLVEILGDGTDLDALESQCRRSGLEDQVAMLGRRDHRSTIATMARWTAGYSGHVATSSDRMYHSPLKLYEYAGLGLDVIATHTDDADDLGACGIRVLGLDIPTTASVADAIRRLLALPRRTPDDIEATRRRVAATHGWSSRIRTLDERLRTMVPSSADVGPRR